MLDCAEGCAQREGYRRGRGSGDEHGGFSAGCQRVGGRCGAIHELRHSGSGQQQGGLQIYGASVGLTVRFPCLAFLNVCSDVSW